LLFIQLAFPEHILHNLGIQVNKAHRAFILMELLGDTESASMGTKRKDCSEEHCLGRLAGGSFSSKEVLNSSFTSPVCP
jgi:hypothetical protein